MKHIEKISGWISFALLLFAIMLAPWFFAAWEMWWFWPFATIIFVSTFFFALRFLVRKNNDEYIRDFTLFNGVGIALLSFMIFLIYAAIRFMQAEIFMNAERSFLLFLTPFLIGINIIFGFNIRQRRILWVALFVNLFVLGLYGIINHFVTGDTLVMWVSGYEQYYKDHRATGSYFCPDHFAGIMELGLCMALSLILDLRSSRGWRIAGVAMSVLAVAAVLFSKSRGGGLTLMVIGLAVIIWGGTQLPKVVRWYLRGAVVFAGVAAIAALWASDIAYVTRFKSYFGNEHKQKTSFVEKKEAIKKQLNRTSRGKMYGAAVRAWKSSPVIGIAPGMHQNLWFHFAPTDDGDKEKNIWPSMTNHEFHSYEVHNDWLQLLEEYGIVGFVLFLIPCGLWFNLLRKQLPDETEISSREKYKPLYAASFAGLLACVCMGFHSLGDFNLQMPATVWLLAAIIALPISLNKGEMVKG
jgi:O-antigen ligase